MSHPHCESKIDLESCHKHIKKEMQDILIISKNKLLIKSVKRILNEGNDRVVVIETFVLILNSIKIKDRKLIIIDCDIPFNSHYYTFIKSIQELTTVPFMLITTITDSRYIENIKYCIPDGYLSLPLNTIDLKICVFLIQAKFDKQQETAIKNDGLENVPFGIKTTLKYIYANIFKKIEIIDLAKLTQWEKHHFAKLFSKYVGKTPYQYILNKKIEKAKLLLMQTDYTSSQISFELGFKSSSNFICAFKNITAASPSSFRHRYFKKK
jgi:AraC-like DNA-binding protein